MLQDRDIVVISGDWNRHPSTVQHIGTVLARNNRLLWVSGISVRSPKFRSYDMRKIADRAFKTVVRRDTPGIPSTVTELHSLVLPFYDIGMVRLLNERLLRASILDKMKQLKFSNAVVLPSTPLVADIIGTLGESSSHYLCVDDYSGFDDVFESLPAMERLLLDKVNSCFASSDLLVHTRKPRNGESHYLPQGVDTNHFKQFKDDVPAAMKDIKRPVVGFFGLITTWVDLDLIVRCAQHYPSVSFVVIGPSSTDVSLFSKFSNITYLGNIPYENLPYYAQMFDIGLIPFRMNPLTRAANPLKLLEYLALGLSVVSTDLPEVRKFKDLVFIAETEDQFVQLVQNALDDRSDEARARRRRMAEQFSWESIVDSMSSTIQRLEGQAKGNPA